MYEIIEAAKFRVNSNTSGFYLAHTTSASEVLICFINEFGYINLDHGTIRYAEKNTQSFEFFESAETLPITQLYRKGIDSQFEISKIYSSDMSFVLLEKKIRFKKAFLIGDLSHQVVCLTMENKLIVYPPFGGGHDVKLTHKCLDLIQLASNRFVASIVSKSERKWCIFSMGAKGQVNYYNYSPLLLAPEIDKKSHEVLNVVRITDHQFASLEKYTFTRNNNVVSVVNFWDREGKQIDSLLLKEPVSLLYAINAQTLLGYNAGSVFLIHKESRSAQKLLLPNQSHLAVSSLVMLTNNSLLIKTNGLLTKVVINWILPLQPLRQLRSTQKILQLLHLSALPGLRPINTDERYVLPFKLLLIVLKQLNDWNSFLNFMSTCRELRQHLFQMSEDDIKTVFTQDETITYGRFHNQLQIRRFLAFLKCLKNYSSPFKDYSVEEMSMSI